ncbi:MAG: S-methyl-5'-thioinosine phosphorylase [Xanthomonadales bacterium]
MMSASVTLALVGGTGLTELDEMVQTISVDTPYGAPSASIREVQSGPVRLLFLPRHGSPHRFPPHCVNYRANMWALREVGADHVLAVSAVGGVCEPYSPATLAVPDQLIDYTWGRNHTFSDSGQVELAHVDFTWPYEGPLRRALLQAARDASIEVVDGGCIGVFQGPRLESSAEVEKARRDGCHMVGMTALPEASLARELSLDYAGLAVVSNWGAGVTAEPLSEDDIAVTLKEPMMRVRALVSALLKRLQANGTAA